MQVYVLTRIDSWDRVETLGVFESAEKAQQFAIAQDPETNYTWEQLTDGGWFVSPHLFAGPIYQYSIEEFEVQ